MLHEYFDPLIAAMLATAIRHSANSCAAMPVAAFYFKKYIIRSERNRLRFPSNTCDFVGCDGRHSDVAGEFPQCMMGFSLKVWVVETGSKHV